jgi:hypothetical protein
MRRSHREGLRTSGPREGLVRTWAVADAHPDARAVNGRLSSDDIIQAPYRPPYHGHVVQTFGSRLVSHFRPRVAQKRPTAAISFAACFHGRDGVTAVASDRRGDVKSDLTPRHSRPIYLFNLRITHPEGGSDGSHGS